MRSPKITILLDAKSTELENDWGIYLKQKRKEKKRKEKDKISLNSSERLYKFIYKMNVLKTCSYTFEP